MTFHVRAAALAALLAATPVPQHRPAGILPVGASHTYHYTAFYPCASDAVALPGRTVRELFSPLMHRLARGGYGTIVALVGVNNTLGGHDAASTLHDIALLDELARGTGVRVRYVTLPPYGGYLDAQGADRAVAAARDDARRAVNDDLRRRSGTIDVVAHLSDDDHYLHEEYRRDALPDGYLHMNNAGYQRLARVIATHTCPERVKRPERTINGERR